MKTIKTITRKMLLGAAAMTILSLGLALWAWSANGVQARTPAAVPTRTSSDDDGDRQTTWARRFHSPEEDAFYSIQQTRDGGYAIAGVGISRVRPFRTPRAG